MGREFTKNMFIMLVTIMIGVVIITFFIADLKARSEEQERYTGEIEVIEQRNINFTNYFMKSSVLLDKAREDRAFGNYHFDLAFLWYQSALSIKNDSLFELYKIRGIENSTNALPYYEYSHLNFEESGNYFLETKSLTTYPSYLEVLDIYIDLTASGSRLTELRYTASTYLGYLTENLTFDFNNNNVTFQGNMTELLSMFDQIMFAIGAETEIFEGLQDEIDEYEFFDEIR